MRVAFAILIVVLAGCAQMGGPPGGPVDDTPPEVVRFFPAPDSTGVAFPHRIRIEFSEKMDKRSVERSLRLFPAPDWVRTEWEGTTLLVETDRTSGADGDSDRPITVTVSDRSEDRRGLGLKEPFVATYTSGLELPTGRISGTVENIQKSRTAPAVTLRVLHPRDEGEEPEVLLESETAETGAFSLFHVPTEPPGACVVLAFQDQNEDRRVDYDFEFYGFSDTLVLSAENPVADSIHIALVNASTPATLTGTVAPALPTDTLVVAVQAEGDTTPPLLAAPDSTGSYAVTKIPPGPYTVYLLRGTTTRALAGGIAALFPALDEKPLRLRPGEARAAFDLAVPVQEPQVTQ